jgi:hypothetical protein
LVQAGNGAATGEVNDDDLGRDAAAHWQRTNPTVGVDPAKVVEHVRLAPADPERAVRVEPHIDVQDYCNLPLRGSECRVGRLFASAAVIEGGQR